MATEASWGNLKNVFGLDDTQIQSLQKAGYTADQATQLMNLSVGGGGTATTGTGGSSTRSYATLPTIGGSGLTPSMLATLATLLGRGGGGNQAQAQAGPRIVSGIGAPDNPQVAGQGAQGGNQLASNLSGQGNQLITGGSQVGGGPGGTQQVTGGAIDPNQVMINLGARALNERAVYPPTPGPADPTSGVSSGIGQSSATGATPTVVTAGVPTARNVGLAGRNLGPWATTPGVFTRVQALQPSTPIGTSPFTPTPQATGTQVARPQPWATAPPAPGVNVQGVVPPAAPGVAPSGQVPTQPGFDAAHNLALTHAGMSLYAHYGGNPFSASPADIAGFHGELQEALKGGKPIKMRSGGLVPGSGNKDNVPALLTPGEYVLTKEQAAQLFDGRTPVKMQSGGSVTDDDDQPSEVPRPTPESDTGAVTAQGKSYQVTPPSEAPRSSRQKSSSTPPAAPGGSSQDYANWANQPQNQQRPAAIYDAQGNVWDSDPKSIAQDVGGKGAYMGPGGEVYDASHNLVTSNADLTAQAAAGPGATMTGNPMIGDGAGGTSNVGRNVGSALGGLASAVSQAAQTYANSIQPWTWQKSAIPNPPSSQGQQPAAQLSQVRAQPSRRQQTISPFTPYYPYT